MVAIAIAIAIWEANAPGSKQAEKLPGQLPNPCSRKSMQRARTTSYNISIYRI
jgi:hypothetical protein